MPSSYLLSGDLAAYGVPSATSAQQAAASAIVDAYLRRPEGLAWSPDSAGAPCFMAALAPRLSLVATGSIAAGQGVGVAFTGGYATQDLIGDVLILDRANSAKAEACVISAVGTGTVTLQGVANAHSASCTMDLGLAITEERAFPVERSTVMVSRKPVARLLSGTIRIVGAPPLWTLFDPTQAGFSDATGEVWPPVGAVPNCRSKIRLRYVAGFAAAAIPAPVKQAAANIITAIANFPELAGNMQHVSAGTSQIGRFGASILDEDTKALLDPFALRAFH
jgi:hypothetical protein